jgi:hypothetical protein
MANATRRDSRQFLVRSGAFSAEQMQKLCSGMDGAYAETDSQEPFGNLIAAVPNVALSSNLDRYLGQIESDIQVASAISVFTRGEASRATATEITALSSYAASSVGKMARERDAMIERLSKTYIRMLHLLTDEKDKAVVVVDNTPTIISTAMLDGRFRYAALDQAATPLSDALKRQQFLSILPVLGQVGVSTQRIKEYVIREFDLPESFLEEDKPEPTRLPSGADVPTGPEGEGIQRTTTPWKNWCPTLRLTQSLAYSAASQPNVTTSTSLPRHRAGGVTRPGSTGSTATTTRDLVRPTTPRWSGKRL